MKATNIVLVIFNKDLTRFAIEKQPTGCQLPNTFTSSDDKIAVCSELHKRYTGLTPIELNLVSKSIITKYDINNEEDYTEEVYVYTSVLEYVTAPNSILNVKYMDILSVGNDYHSHSVPNWSVVLSALMLLHKMEGK